MAPGEPSRPLRLGFGRGSRAASVFVAAFLVAISAGAVAPWTPPEERGDWQIVLFPALLMATYVSCAWGPKVVADRRGIAIVNIVWSYWVPWSAVESIGGSAYLEVTTRDGRAITAWAVQAHGRTFALARARVERAAAELRAMSAETDADGPQSAWSRRWCWPRWHHVLAVCAVLGIGAWAAIG